MKPILSIITPVLNNEKYISKAIDNYLSQSNFDSELIVVDGVSSDSTLQIVKSYASSNKNIRWISEYDSGQSDAMNKGILLAEGEYVSFLNVDDFYSLGTFFRVLEILKSNPKIDFLVGDCNVWNEMDELIFVNKPFKTNKWHILSGYHFSVNPTAYFYRKSIHQYVGYYNEENHYNMDLEFLIKARMHYRFHYIPEVWGNFRMLPNTKTVTEMNSNLLEIRKKELLNQYFKKSSYYLQLRVILYKYTKIYLPKIIFQFTRIIDKIKFEIKKFIY